LYEMALFSSSTVVKQTTFELMSGGSKPTNGTERENGRKKHFQCKSRLAFFIL
jgi:hypothetical protein